jgi:tetratricopeptide (TPR) repeat protein
MSQSKKPVILVAIFLGALILLPVFIWVVLKVGGPGDSGPAVPAVSVAGTSGSEAVDYDLSQLAEKTEKLLVEEIADALRKGDVSLDFVAGLNKEIDKARSDMRSGKLQRAKERFLSVVTAAENQLAAIGAADKARNLKATTYAELQRLDPLRAKFENTYREAVESYDRAVRSLQEGAFLQAVDEFELAAAILGDLEARAIQQVAGLLEAAQAALEKYKLGTASEAFQAVLEIDAANSAATEGLDMVAALEGIADAVKEIQALEAKGQLEEAMVALEQLAAEHPNNSFIKSQRASLEARIIERDFNSLVASSVKAEAAADLSTAIADLEAALDLKTDKEQQARLAKLEGKYKATRLEMLLEDGFQALKGGRYEAARNLYKEAVALDSNSKEARTGLEKASSLYLAGIRYSQNVASAERYIDEGRYPLAAKFFNQAMTTRPTTLAPAQLKKEDAIRKILEAQSKEAPVVVASDGRTYVSIIGVLPPDRFREKDLKLFPDVYKIRGTRKDYKDVEKEFKVDATKGSQTITVECTEKL